MSKKVYVIINAVMAFAGCMGLLMFAGVWAEGSLDAAINAMFAGSGFLFEPELPVWLNVAMVALVFVLPVVLIAVCTAASWESRGTFGRVVECLLGSPLCGALLSLVGLLMWGLVMFVWSNWQLTIVAVLVLIAAFVMPSYAVYVVRIKRIR